MRPIWLGVAVLLPMLSGCVGTASDEETELVFSSTVPSHATFGGVVTDDEFRPIAGVTVTVTGTNASATETTDGDGAFATGSLVGDHWVVSYSHPDYVPLQRNVAIQAAGDMIDASATMSLLPDRRYRTDILQPVNGRYDCGWEAVIFTGDCMILWEEYVSPEDPLTSESNYFFFNASQRWTQVIVELTWTEAGTNQLDGLHLYLAPANESKDPSEHHTKMAVAEGDDQPLRIELTNGDVHPTAERYAESDVQAQLEPTGGEVMVLVLPRGQLADTIGEVCDPTNPDRCFLGVGFGLEVEFTVYVGVFYNGPAPDGFTMVPE